MDQKKSLMPSQKSMNGSSEDVKKDVVKDDKEATKKKPSGLVSKMIRGFQHGVGSGSSGSRRIIKNQTQNASQVADNSKSSSPEGDVSHQKALEAMLNRAIQSSRSVDNAGLRSPETQVNSLPEGLDRGDNGCEIIPAHNLHPFQGPHGNCKSRNGVKVFSCASATASFLSQNFNSVERFSVVIQHLTTVFKVHLDSCAIYYEPKGHTIAFNSNKSLYFNLRYFCSLHQNHVDGACYSYWYMTFAHELAHNLVSAHNKQHGAFTESIASLYLPDFVQLLSRII